MTTTIDNEHKTFNVPNLRFKEFQGEWEKTIFGDIATGFDYGMNAAAKSYDGENKYIRITDIDESSSTYDDKDIVSPDGTLSDNYLVKERDILLARTGASTGKTYLYRKSDGKLYYAGFYLIMYLLRLSASLSFLMHKVVQGLTFVRMILKRQVSNCHLWKAKSGYIQY